MVRESSFADEEVETTPAPGSATVASVASSAPEENPFVQFVLGMTPEQKASCDALWEACDRYGDDHDRAYEDLMAGQHPLQQRRPAAR
jgi:hypothetical protein